MSEKEGDLEFIGFRAESQLDNELRDLAYEHKMTKSELLRQVCQYGVDHIDQILNGDSEAEPADA
ncbi:hypothetical protein [Halostella sp. PRR32]|uniref:hypothetical protein n=1 Tax=Halostella sp. PRR32 TaxID=3098147 RepID=UPI002B1D03D3|nr:hypothetical protein [Halostella sp. PRR32]